MVSTEYTEISWREYVVVEEASTKSKDVGLNDNEAISKQKIEVIFLEIDKSANGWVEKDEFQKFILKLGVKMSDHEFDLLIEEIDKDKSGKIDFEEFFNYYYSLLLRNNNNNNNNNENTSNIQGNLSKAGPLKEIAFEVQEKKRKSLLKKVVKELHYKANANTSTGLQGLINQNKNFRESEAIDVFDDKLLELYDDTEAADLSDFIEERWDAFTDFNRKGKSGKCVMSTDDDDVTDALPGDYDLVQLVMTQYHEVPDMKIPRHVVLKKAEWIKAGPGEKDGKFICSSDWDGIIPVDIGTNQLLAYYGACLAGEKQEKVALLQRHCTVDFDYAKSYHDDYVIATCGGNGIEQHGFHHMDCPLDDDSGFFLLGKWVGNEELHLTAFKILKNHVLYVPPNTIHSNDHLIGTWRTMLSDAKDAPINHVIMYTQDDNASESLKLADVTFETSITHFGNSLKNTTCHKCEK
ncbi:uncharacterized protein LOC130644725 [Hydractinia symbiolongicarpus]|uniref:uncharacterized protein LOC130644725 n=1 Tax=Hydractinia symbiolongicarpus TaxID=13093 RepID=UPI00254E0748|nr:uncharacterized protein LOC130644725 [Hydractinia symbiolongicarpus]